LRINLLDLVRRSKIIFLIITIVFLIIVMFFIYDFSRKTTFPGSSQDEIKTEESALDE